MHLPDAETSAGISADHGRNAKSRHPPDGHATVFPPTLPACRLMISQCRLVAGTWLALESGEAQRNRVEGYVEESILLAHERIADVFLILATVALGTSITGTRAGRTGRISRGITIAAGLALLVIGWRVGRAGGELVYRHDAANAFSLAGAVADEAKAGNTATCPAGEGTYRRGASGGRAVLPGFSSPVASFDEPSRSSIDPSRPTGRAARDGTLHKS